MLFGTFRYSALTVMIAGASICNNKGGATMSRQLNLRVSDEFAERLERLSKRVGRPMAAVLESVGTPAIEAAEADEQFEADALSAWEDYQLKGEHVSAATIDDIFAEALTRAESVAKSRGA